MGCSTKGGILSLVLVGQSDAHAMLGMTDPAMEIPQSIVLSGTELLESMELHLRCGHYRIVSGREDKGHFWPRTVVRIPGNGSIPDRAA